jgi:hypothetical protein
MWRALFLLLLADNNDRPVLAMDDGDLASEAHRPEIIFLFL